MQILKYFSILIFIDPQSGSDVCGRLCEEYSANRQGNGFDLCDEPSWCYRDALNGNDYCSNLYWSGDYGEDMGLIYERNATTLTFIEHAMPVTCIDAVELVNGPQERIITSVISFDV